MKTAADPPCPTCGAPVNLNAVACRECGARRGPRDWIRPEIYDGLDLPGADDDFDYEAFLAEEFGAGPKTGWRTWPSGKKFWWATAVLTLIAFGWVALWHYHG